MCVCVQERGRESLRRGTWAELARQEMLGGSVGSRGPMQPMSAPYRMPCSSLEPWPCRGGGPVRSGVESAVRGCGLWVAGVRRLGALLGGGAAQGTADRSLIPHGTADKSPSRHVDGTLSTFTVLLKALGHDIRP